MIIVVYGLVVDNDHGSFIVVFLNQKVWVKKKQQAIEVFGEYSGVNDLYINSDIIVLCRIKRLMFGNRIYIEII